MSARFFQNVETDEKVKVEDGADVSVYLGDIIDGTTNKLWREISVAQFEA